MEKQAGIPQSESDELKKSKKSTLMAQYEDRFEDAIVDAQYMMFYASTNCPNDIDQATTKKLINARQHVARREPLSAEEEAEFWFNYQKLWKLVQPAAGTDHTITAESIKANMPLEKTFLAWLLSFIPALSQWTEKWTISKSRKTVNRYITFTALVLFLLLSFQIYWVIGNQVVTELSRLSENEKALKASQQEYDAIVNQLKPNEKDSVIIPGTSTTNDGAKLEGSTPDNKITSDKFTDDLKELTSSQYRYAAILQFWSKPWKDFIKVERVIVEHDKTIYGPKFDENDKQLKVLKDKLNDDPTGTKTASEEGVEKNLNEQLAEINIEIKKLSASEQLNSPLITTKEDIQEKIKSIEDKKALEALLIDLKANKVAIEELNIQIKTLKAQFENLKSAETDSQGQVSFSAAQLETLQSAKQSIEDIDNLVKEIDELKKDSNTPNPNQSEIDKKQQTIDDLVNGLPKLLEAYPYYTSGMITGLEEHRRYIDDEIAYWKDYKLNFDNQIASLQTEQEFIDAQIEILKTNITDLTNQFADPNVTPQTIDEQIKSKNDQIRELESKVADSSSGVDNTRAKDIVENLKTEIKKLEVDRGQLEIDEEAYLDKVDSKPAQLAGQFVLNILQNYILPILYGLLGAGTSVLRSLSRKIKDVTYSESTGVQHILSISLGALAGIMVGWFSFLIDSGTFLGSVSPLAIAFFVGYNIEPFFSRMDNALKVNEVSQQTIPAIAKETKPAAPQKASKSSSKKTKAAKGKSGTE